MSAQAGRLAGKRAVVTGAGSGIGAAIARQFAAEGARVFAVDLVLPDEVVAALGPSGSSAVADVSVEAEISAAIAGAAEQWAGLDVLVNVAGIIGPAVELTEMPAEDFDRVLAVNTRGPFLAMKHAIPAMTTGASIVNMSSLAGLAASPGTPIAYAASKGALVAMTKAAAVACAERGIRVNAICPGLIDTPLITLPPQQRERRAIQHPLGRMGRPDEVAQMAVFLACDESSFSTGSTFVMDGGRLARA